MRLCTRAAVRSLTWATLVFLPAMYSIWFKIRPGDAQPVAHAGESAGPQLMTGS